VIPILGCAPSRRYSSPVGGGGSVPADAILVINWATATGQTNAALWDTDKPVPLTWQIGNGAANIVVSATGLGFPAGMTNVLKCVLETPSGSPIASPSDVLRIGPTNDAGLGEIPNGTSRFLREYLRVEFPDDFQGTPGIDGQTHPIQDGIAVGDSNWMLQVFITNGGVKSVSVGEWLLRYNLIGNRIYEGPVLNKFNVYRLERHIQRTSSSEYHFHAKVFDDAVSTTVPLFEDEDFDDLSSSGNMADDLAHTFNQVDRTAGLNFGHNGLFDLPSGLEAMFPMTATYQGGAMMRTDDWCGPFDPAEQDWAA
jgi:hypothetical protein